MSGLCLTRERALPSIYAGAINRACYLKGLKQGAALSAMYFATGQLTVRAAAVVSEWAMQAASVLCT